MLIQQLQQRLDKGRADLNALSCTFYFRDPYWSDEFRLVAMSGVRLKEPMYGFVSPASARNTILKGQQEIFKQTQMARRLRETPVILKFVPEEKRHLFGDFILREGVNAYARLTHVNDDGEREAILFVNFSKRTKFDPKLTSKIRRFFKALLADFDKIQKELIEQDALWLTEATRVVTPELSIANIDFYTLDRPDPYFTRIIEAALNALHIKPGTGLGTLHLYNAEDHTLELRGFFGPIQHPERAERHSVRTGEGVVSWVALRRKALLIQNIDQSDFRDIHVWLNDDVKSELAVPLEVGGEMIGVMCLECTEVDGFLPHHVRSVWYAANRAVIIYQLHQQVSMNRKLLELTWKATSGRGGEARTSLNEVATLAKDYLKGSFCNIWRYNSDSERFDNLGSSYTGFSYPGPKGWTDFVLRSKHTVWISDIRSESEFSIHYWQSGSWVEGAPSGEHPKKLNPETFEKSTQSALGIPINVRDYCIGVAWIMYRRESLECPKPGLMSLALGFAAEAGLVLDSIQRQEGELKDKRSIDSVGEEIYSGIQSRWELDDCSLLDVHVISHPYHSQLGGDFYAGKIIDKDTVGILLLDGQGHGVEGSLHMLPLMTAFESFWQSYSTAHVISQLTKTSELVGVKGSAIYCIFSIIDEKRWLSVTSAGHDSLIRFKKDGRGRFVHEYFPESHGPFFGNPKREPLMDYRVELSPGDVVVGYTDGVAEEKTGFDANHVSTLVMDALLQKSDGPKDIAEAIIQGSRRHHPEGFKDDATVFVIRVK